MDRSIDDRQRLIDNTFKETHEDDWAEAILKYKITRREIDAALRSLDFDATDIDAALRSLDFDATDIDLLVAEFMEQAHEKKVDSSFLNEPVESPPADATKPAAVATHTKTFTTADDADDLGQLLSDAIENKPRELWAESVVNHRIGWELVYCYFEYDEPGWLDFVSELREYAQRHDADLSFFDFEKAEAPLPPTQREAMIHALHNQSLDEIARAVIDKDIQRRELTNTFDSSRLSEIDSAVTEAYNTDEELAAQYWGGLVRDLSPTLTAEKRREVIDSLSTRPVKVAYNEIFLHKISRHELKDTFDEKEVGSIMRKFQYYCDRYSVDIAFLYVESPAVLVPVENPVAVADENGENSAAGNDGDETSTLSSMCTEEIERIIQESSALANARHQNVRQTRSTTRTMVLSSLEGVADINVIFKHILDHKLTFREVSRALPEARFQAVIFHIFNLREEADLAAFWKLGDEVTRPTRIYTHCVIGQDGFRQNEPSGFMFLRRNLRFWLLPPLPFPIPPCPRKPTAPPIILPGCWPAGITLHGDPKVPAMLTLDALPALTQNNNPTVQFNYEGRILGWSGKNPTVQLLQSPTETLRIAAEKLQKAKDANAAAVTRFENDVRRWATAQRRYEWTLFRLAQQHIDKIFWTRLADASRIMAADEASAYCDITVEEVTAKAVNEALYQKRKRQRDE